MVTPVPDRADEPDVLVLTGPTGAGKSALALEYAERHGCEILSMDSMAVYRRMDIGTAKPDSAERARVRHWLVDLVDPNESYDTSRWCAEAEATIAALRARGMRPLLVGGTPLYLQALAKGLMPGVPADVAARARFQALEAATPGALHAELERVDPAAASRIHRNDTKRLVRALEVHAVTGKPISELQAQWAAPSARYPLRVVALTLPREELHQRIKVRTIAMLERGLVAETRAIRDEIGFSREAGAAIGYAQCLEWLQGRYKDEEELRNRIRRATHGLVRRQTTWLRRMRDVVWLSAGSGVAELAAAFTTARPASTTQ